MLAAWGGCPIARFVLVVAKNTKMVVSTGSSLDCSSLEQLKVGYLTRRK